MPKGTSSRRDEPENSNDPGNSLTVFVETAVNQKDAHNGYSNTNERGFLARGEEERFGRFPVERNPHHQAYHPCHGAGEDDYGGT
ncbi:hypothetical protein AAFP32_03950 [Brevibacterium sp. CBA3109]|uniref:Uncharacterized protein n=1 Tax=Brevibacterium koreense TaxID=3140787 RepID=A0AAU7UNK9_9MICO